MSLRTAPLSVRALALSVLATMGLGYLLAMVYLFGQKVVPHQGEGATVVESVQYSYHGVPTATPKLLVALQGSMGPYVSPQEYDRIAEWIDEGATEDGYRNGVKNIIERNCASCHKEGGDPPLVEDFETAVALTAPDTGVGLPKLAKMTHIHVFGIPMVFFMISVIFVKTRWKEWLKAALIIVPFAGVVFDIAHWWITKLDPNAALGIVIGGAFMGVGFVGQWFLTFFDIVLPYRGSPATRSESGGADTRA